MADIEKVINCLTDIENIMIARKEICPREELQYWIELQEGVADAIAILEEQETPSKEELIAHYGKMYKCRRCGLEWYQQTQKYCQECGTAVKWG